MTDVVTPKFHEKIKQGEIINNPCTYSAVTFEAIEDPEAKQPSEFSITDIHNNTWTKTGGFFTAGVAARMGSPFQWWNIPQCSLPTYDDVAEAKQKCLGEVDSTPYEFFEDVAEIRETLAFLRNPLLAIKNLSKSFQRAKRRITRRYPGATPQSSRELAKALADLWNQYQFAFAPLVRSLCDAWEAMEKWEDIERPTRRSAHWRAEQPPNTAISHGDTIQWGGRTILVYREERERYRKTHATIHYEVTNPLNDWKFKLGLRSKDIPSVAWQIIPLSFMVDRLYDINSFIKGLVNLADPSVAILAGSVTSKTYDICNLTCVGTWNTYRHFSTALPEPWDWVKRTNFTYERSIWEPELSDTVPVLDWRGLVEDAVKTGDLIAITISRLL